MPHSPQFSTTSASRSGRPAGAGACAASTVRRAAGALACLLAALSALALLAPRAAHADQMTVYSCHDPAGDPVGHAGWTIERTPQPYMTAADSCAAGGQGALYLGLGASPYGYPNAARVEWVFSAPSWAEIAGYTLHLAGSYARPSSGGGSGQVFVDDSDQSDPIYDYRNLGAGSLGPATIRRSPSAPVSRVTVNASCDGERGPCPAGVEIARVQVPSAAIVLDDLSTPTVGDLTGSLTSGQSLTGRAEVSFQAHDEGPGLYSAWLIVDGHAQPAILLGSNDGLCRDLGPAAQTARSFSSPTPCAASASGSLTLDTASLPDGRHTVKLMVDDAAGNTTLAWSATITTENAPIVSTPPSIAGSAEVGTALTATPATFTAPAGAGALSDLGGQWLRCGGRPGGGECAPIAGADTTAYTPGSADVGYRLLFRSSASDTDGMTRSDSPLSPLVTEPAPEPAPAPAPEPARGPASAPSSGSGPAGGAVAIASGGAGGGASASSTASSVSARVGRPRRSLGSRTPWRLTLRTRPHRIRRGVRIHIAGSVLSAPRPPRGKLIYLRARTVWTHTACRRTTDHGGCCRRGQDHGRHRRRRGHGRWVAFAVLHTRPGGSFSVTHRFRLGGRHAYQIQAIAPAVGGYLNTTGRSRAITIDERPGRPARGRRRHRRRAR